MIDTGKDAIDVVATVTAKVGETMVEEGTQGVGGLDHAVADDKSSVCTSKGS